MALSNPFIRVVFDSVLLYQFLFINNFVKIFICGKLLTESYKPSRIKPTPWILWITFIIWIAPQKLQNHALKHFLICQIIKSRTKVYCFPVYFKIYSSWKAIWIFRLLFKWKERKKVISTNFENEFLSLSKTVN